MAQRASANAAARLEETRSPSLRIRAEELTAVSEDRVIGSFEGGRYDFVVRRNDGFSSLSANRDRRRRGSGRRGGGAR